MGQGNIVQEAPLSLIEEFEEKGYLILDFKDVDILNTMRSKILKAFNTLTTFYGAGSVESDRDIISLYRSEHRPLWVAVYEQMRYLPEVGTLLNHPEIMAMVKLLGIKFPVWTQTPMIRIDMPDDDKWNFDVHQDFVYNYSSYNSVTFWIPFQDVDLDSGALHVVPGSHKLGVLETESALMKGYSPQKHGEFIQVAVPFGKVLVFSQHIIHKSGSNRSNTVRITLQTRYSDLESEEYMKRHYYLHRKSLPKKNDLKFPEEAR